MTVGPPDTQLWQAAVDGDGTAFAAFYRWHGNRVFAHCARRTLSRSDAEDLTAEVFAIAWRKRAVIRPDPDVDILPWLLTTANLLLRHHHRSLARARELLRRYPRDPGLPDIADEIANKDYDAHTARVVLATLDRLRIADREVIELCVLQGLTPTAVALATGEPASTVRARLSRALSRARTLYERHRSLQADALGLAGAGE